MCSSNTQTQGGGVTDYKERLGQAIKDVKKVLLDFDNNVIFFKVMPFSSLSHLHTDQTVCPQTKDGNDLFPGKHLINNTYIQTKCAIF